MENHVPVSPCSATVTLGTYAALWPENLDGCADAVEMLHSACWRTDVKEVVPCLHCLYRKPEKVFKPTETPLFLTVFVGLTGFEPATFCYIWWFLGLFCQNVWRLGNVGISTLLPSCKL